MMVARCRRPIFDFGPYAIRRARTAKPVLSENSNAASVLCGNSNGPDGPALINVDNALLTWCVTIAKSLSRFIGKFSDQTR